MSAIEVDNYSVVYRVSVNMSAGYNFTAGTLMVRCQSGGVAYYSGIWDAATSSFTARINLSCSNPMVELTAFANAVSSFCHFASTNFTNYFTPGICFANDIDPCDSIPWNADPGACERNDEPGGPVPGLEN